MCRFCPSMDRVIKSLTTHKIERRSMTDDEMNDVLGYVQHANPSQLAAAHERIAALEAELEIARSVVEIARAALAGSQGLGGEAIGSCMGCGGDIRLVNGEPGGPCPHCMPQANTEAETTAPECRDGWHAIRPGEGACICGENRMELLL